MHALVMSFNLKFFCCWMLYAWTSTMTTKGEVFEASRLLPAPSPGLRDYTNRLWKACQGIVTAPVPPGTLETMCEELPGIARVGARLPHPPIVRRVPIGSGYVRRLVASNTWQDLEAQLKASAEALREVRELLAQPPASQCLDAHKWLDEPPNFIAVRVAAQALHDATINELHKGDLEAALDDLVALTGAARLYSEDPSLVNQMIRVAVTGLGVGVTWEALQAAGWTEPQLARLQAAWQAVSILPQMERAFQGERAIRLHQYEKLRSLPYDQWLACHEPIRRALGMGPSRAAAPVVRFWRQWFFHPVWSFAWARQEELLYARQEQPNLDAIHEMLLHPCWVELDRRLSDHRDSYRPPMANWRFYQCLPMLDEVSEPGAPA